MENLKESYESEIKEIKKLQDEIHTNNVEIKQLLRASQASHSQEEVVGDMSILEEQSCLPQ